MKFTESEENILSLFSSGYWEESDTQFPDVLIENILNYFDLSKFPLENIFEGTIKEKIKHYYKLKYDKCSPLFPLEEMCNYNSNWMRKLNTDFDPNLKKYATFYLHPKNEKLESDISLIYKLNQKNRDSYIHKSNLSIVDVKNMLTHILKLLFFTGEKSIEIYDRYSLQNILLNQKSYDKNIAPLFSILDEIADSYKREVILNFHSVFKTPKELNDTETEINLNNSVILKRVNDIRNNFKNLKIKSYVYFDKSGKDVNNHSRYFLFSDLCFFADKGIQILTILNSRKQNSYKVEINFKLANEYEKNEISEYIAKTKPSYTFG